jgi:hypothetical protein
MRLAMIGGQTEQTVAIEFLIAQPTLHTYQSVPPGRWQQRITVPYFKNSIEVSPAIFSPHSAQF